MNYDKTRTLMSVSPRFQASMGQQTHIINSYNF
jgi:hypothetical protein